MSWLVDLYHISIISSALRDIWLSKNVIKLERQIYLGCIYILSQGQFSCGNNNSSKRMNLASFTVQQNKLDSHKAGTVSQKRLFAELV